MRIGFRELKNRLRQVRAETSVPTDGIGRRVQRAYLDGWVTQEEVLPSGKVRQRHVYAGPVYRAELSRRARIVRKLLSLLLTLLAAGLLAASVLLAGSAGSVWYVYIPQALSVMALLFLLWYSCVRVFAREELTKGEFRENARDALLCALLSALLLALTAAVTLAHRLLGGGAGELPAALAALAAAGCAWGICALELSTAYVITEPGKEPRRLSGEAR